ncbi:hypothetical protein HDR66_01875 [bacterium]|nr:hypothetical protein [bacterium]
MTRTKKLTATEQTFEEYKSYILQTLCTECPISYVTPESLQDWQNTIRYNEKTMAMIMCKSIVFISTINSVASNGGTCPNLLGALIAKIANYLSTYQMRGDARLTGAELSEKNINKAQAAARNAIQAQLMNCRFMQNLLEKQAMAREQRKANGGRKAYAKSKQSQRAADAEKAYKTKCQVRGMFIDAQNIVRNGR